MVQEPDAVLKIVFFFGRFQLFDHFWLGTTTTDGNRREVKVEVLGVLERGTGRMRLRATEPIAGSNQAERFARIFKVIQLAIFICC